MHLILTGATGLVGSAVLHTMLTTPSVTKISILSRRPVAQAEGHSKAKVYIQKDFSAYESSVLDELKDAHGVVWAQGISSTAVDKPEYKRITSLYPLSFARAISKTTSPSPITFIYISGEGATPTPSFTTQHWQRIKGQTEADLLSLSKDPEFKNLRPISVRPGGVDPRKHTEIHEFLPQGGWFKKMTDCLLPMVNVVMPSIMSPTRELGKVIVDLAMSDGEALKEDHGITGEGRTVANVAVRRMVGL